MTVTTFARRISRLLRARQLTVSVCESCTGGMLGAVITAVPGSSAYFLGGVIAYANSAKTRIVDVRPSLIKRFGVVSDEVAREMASGVRKRLGSHIGIGVTGIAGPDGGSREKPVGTVFIAIARKTSVTVKRYTFKGSRKKIREAACKHALEQLEELLLAG